MARAKDVNNAVGEWGTFKVIIPRKKLSANILFIRLIEQLQYLFPILRQIFFYNIENKFINY